MDASALSRSPSSSEGSKRKRKPAPRVKTGCLTCKYRRVKCGEERPICHRCIKFDVECEGYPAESPPNQNTRQLLPISQSNPSETLFSSELEHQYFALFCDRTGYEILPGFGSGSIRHTLLQLCQSDPCIRHAIVAIGALDKTAELTRDFGSLSLSPGKNNGNPHHTAALEHYTTAIQYMNHAATDSNLDLKTQLITCLLIICFEAWNGNLPLAVQQVQIAVALLHEWFEGFSSCHDMSDGLSPAPDIIDHDLLQIFCRLSIQLAFVANESATATPGILGAKGRALVTLMPPFFSTLSEAVMYQQAIQRRGGHFVANHSIAWGSSNPTPTPESFLERAEIEYDCRQWLCAFESLVLSIEGVEEKREAHTILLQMTSGLISIATALSRDEGIYDNYTDIFKQIVDLAEDVLESYPQTSRSGNTHFCFHTRIILPLWKAGLKCRDGEIRRKAVRLLLSRPMKEGIWDSILAARMVAWVVELEEEGLFVGEPVPVWKRVEGVRWSSEDLEARKAMLMCRQRVSEDGEQVLRCQIVDW